MKRYAVFYKNQGEEQFPIVTENRVVTVTANNALEAVQEAAKTLDKAWFPPEHAQFNEKTDVSSIGYKGEMWGHSSS